MSRTTTSFFALALALALTGFAPSAAALDAGSGDIVTAAPTPTATGRAAEASVSHTISPESTVEVGAPITVTLTVEHGPGASVEVIDRYEPERWRFIDKEAAPTSEGATSSTWTLRFALVRPGESTLAPIELHVRDAKGATAEVFTGPITIKAVSVLQDGDELSFKPPRPPREVWVEDYTLAWLGGFGVGAALLGLLGLWVHRRQAMVPPPPPPPRAAHEIALEKLAALAADDLVERGEFMIFYVRLSEAIREYLGRRYGFPPHELTTSEILHEVRDVVWPAGISDVEIAKLLRHCDSVKFGGLIPSVEAGGDALRQGFSIVELTRGAKTQREAAADEPEESSQDRPQPSEPERVAGRSRWAPPAALEAQDDGAPSLDEVLQNRTAAAGEEEE